MDVRAKTKRPGPRMGAGTLLVVRPLLFPDHRAGESPVPERPRLWSYPLVTIPRRARVRKRKALPNLEP